MPASPPTYSFIRRLVVGLTLAVSIVSALVIVVFAAAEIHKGRAALEEDADKAIDSLGRLLDRPLWDFDQDRARLIGNVFLDDQRVTQLDIRESSGRQIVDVKRGDSSDVIERKMAITHDGRTIGEVRVTFARASYLIPVWREAGVAGALSVLVILTVFLMTGLLIRRYLRRPLDEMSLVVNAYSAGNYAPVADQVPYEEFTPFASLLGRMGQRIQAQVDELQTLNTELRQRAVELSQSNERLQGEITERTRAEQELQRSRTMIEQVLNSVPLSVFWKDTNGVYLGCNPVFAAEARLASPKDVIGKTDLELPWPRAEAERYRADDQQLLQQQRSKLNHVEEIDLGKKRRWISISKVLLKNAEGQSYGVLGLYEDITERRENEEELAKYRTRLEDLVKERTEALQREIAERKRIEEALRHAKEAAESANTAKSTFLASMSHEIRTPLNAILGYSHLLKRDESLSQKNHQALSAISKSGEHLLDLISDILEMSKIEAGRSTLDEIDFDLHDLLHSLESMFGLRVQEKGLRFILDFDRTLPRYVRTDQRKLRQVLFNLLSNAVRFTATGSITLRAGPPERSGSVDPRAITLTFEVADTGAGISPAEQASLFQPFAQTESGRQVAGGAGLGLAISRGFVELMGGTIRGRSTVGAGSTFAFTIQALQTERPLQASISGEILRVRGNGTPPRILVVDDHTESRRLLSELLNSAGFETREASNGEEAIRVWRDWRPQLIWMDMNMPVLDGYQATRAIVSEDRDRQTKIVALTASIFEEDRGRMLACGCVDCLSKPFRENDIFECIARYLPVEYEKRERAAAEPRADPIDVIIAHYREIPAAERERIAHATRTLDAQTLLDIVASVREQHPVVAGFLKRTAEQLDFEALHKLVTREEGEN